MKSFATVLMMMAAGAAVAAPSGGVRALPTSPGSELSGGLYYVTGNPTISSSTAGQPGLKVASGQTAAIYIPKGSTLTVKGGDGFGQTGGGAGIAVPSNSTLVVTGGGTLKATGGNAGNGQDGGHGKDADIDWFPEEDDEDDLDDAKVHSGTGGNGGAGGGGAGAGIGGSGGKGGDGGAGGGEQWAWWNGDRDDFMLSGKSGDDGKAGDDAKECGTVVFMGSLTVEPKSGAKGTGGEGVKGSGWIWISGGNDYAGWGGGGGGGGAGGAGLIEGIGWGAESGGGGGGGGGGCTTWITDSDDLVAHNGWGEGGKGGRVFAGGNGTDGSSYYGEKCTGWENENEWGIDYGWGMWGPADGTFGMKGDSAHYQDKTRGGKGGNGGATGASGDAAFYTGVSISSGVTVNDSVAYYFATKDLKTHDAIKYAVKFADPKGVLFSTPADATAYLGMAYPEIKPSAVKDLDLALDGWYTAESGGTKVYEGTGKPVLASYEFYQGDVTLYPRTKDATNIPTGVKVNGMEAGKDSLPAGCMYSSGVVSLPAGGTYTLSGENVAGRVAFRVESGEPVSIVLDGLQLVNERSDNSGLIDLEPGASATITLKGTSNRIEAYGDSVAAIHCPYGASVKIVGERSLITDRKIELYNEWTVKDEPFHLGCNYGAKGATFDLTLKSGPGAAAIGGIRGEYCGDITITNCDLSCTPNGGVKAKWVHEIGDGLLDENADKTLGGHVTFIGIIAMRSSIRSGASDVDVLTIARPRPHDEYGVPLTPAWMGNWAIFLRPGMLKFGSSTIQIPRSGQSVVVAY